MKHSVHETWHTFRSKLDNANKTCIDLLMGHKPKGVGERVYTHKTAMEMKDAIELIN
jgi:integrase